MLEPGKLQAAEVAISNEGPLGNTARIEVRGKSVVLDSTGINAWSSTGDAFATLEATDSIVVTKSSIYPRLVGYSALPGTHTETLSMHAPIIRSDTSYITSQAAAIDSKFTVAIEADRFIATDSHFWAAVSGSEAGEFSITADSILLRGTEMTSTADGSATSESKQTRLNLTAKSELVLDHSFVGSNTGVSSRGFSRVAAGDIVLAGAAIDISSSQIMARAGGDLVNVGGGLNSGNITVTGTEIRIRESALTSSTISPVGVGGNVLIAGHALDVAASEISSDSLFRATDAGNVRIELDGRLSLNSGTVVSSSTESSQGRAGVVQIKAAEIAIDGGSSVSAIAKNLSSGFAGAVSVTASRSLTLANGATLSIQNDATSGPTQLARAAVSAESVPAESVLHVTAPQMSLSGAELTASATGNFAASDVQVSSSDHLIMRNSAIRTTATNGSGGSIQVNGGRIMVLDHSQVCTSVLGTEGGNGGDIRVRAQNLVMDTGFIQANTRVPQASGGSVFIDVGAMVAHGGSVLVGGNTPFEFDPRLTGVNVIQAAAPNGVSGNVSLTVPVLDIAGSLKGLSAEVISLGAMSKDLCRIGGGSSLTPLGRGGLLPTTTGFIRSESQDAVAREQGRAAEAGSGVSALYKKDVAAYRCEQ